MGTQSISGLNVTLSQMKGGREGSREGNRVGAWKQGRWGEHPKCNGSL